ncbi:MAG: hypothetical protein ABIS20_24335 [Thermoanaerobaculia bacterium]
MQADPSSAISAIETSIREAERSCDRYYRESHDEDDLDSSKYYVERAFVELLVLTDRLQLMATYRMITEAFEKAQSDGFGKTESYDGEVYLHWAGRVRLFTDAIASAHGLAKTAASELLDLKAMLRRAVYVICDTSLYGVTPRNEADVHARLEGIIKCYYPDLKSKPLLTKPIKNFQPDSAIPSAKTLLEYKFITSRAEAKRVCDEILADASGYRSSEWRNLLFVIYEAYRVLPEEEWQELLSACQLHEGFDAIVLSGVAPVSAA